MSRTTPLYSMIRPPSVYASSPAYTQSAPNLRRYTIRTQQIPMDIDAIRTATTFINERERYLSEPVSFIQFACEKESVYHSPVRARYGSLASPASTLERIPYSQPVSSSIENSAGHATNQSTPPLSPVIPDTHPEGRGYTYLRPPLTPTMDRDERTTKDLETEYAYLQYQEHATTIFSPFPFTQNVKAIIRDNAGDHFEVHRRPYTLLAPGMRVACFGDMVGVWFATGEMRQQDGYVMWKWVNHDTRYSTIVRVPSRFVRSPTWAERAKRTFKKLRRMAARTFEIE
ncbi:hypothetical protein C8R47DRAFT_1210298 [Mycena vitilis]|nr:hypothetical protein C8R47DRAFT_1210298 [Mycena vitilis]